MRETPKAFELYRHFKGNLYQILAIATDSEDASLKVVYQAMYGDYKVYVRALDSFLSATDKVKYPDAAQEYRFEKVAAPETGQQAPREDRAADTEAQAVCAAEPDTEAQTVYATEPDTEAQTANAAEAYTEPQAADSPHNGTDSAEIDPAVSAYLDANDTEERLNILSSVHHRITDDMLATMAMVSDIEFEDVSVEEKYQSLMNCLLTKQKFEITRRF